MAPLVDRLTQWLNHNALHEASDTEVLSSLVDELCGLERREGLYRRLVETTSEGVWVIDPQHRTTYVNQALASMLGYARANLLDMTIYDVVDPSQHAQLDRNRAERVEGRGNEYELPLRTADGEEVWALVRATPMHTPAGHYEGVFAMLTNITLEKSQQAQLEAAAQVLSQRNKELEEFAYIASHDLKSPLNTVYGFLQLFQDRYEPTLDDDAKEYLGFMGEGVERMIRLINDLLHFSRVSNKDLQIRPLDLTTLVQVQVNQLHQRIEATQAQITVEPLPIVPADQRYLGQVFQNLIENALTYHRPDVPPAIHVSATREAGYWRIDVTDNGMGLAKLHLDRIFDMFQRLHAEEDYPGTGIGLAICRRVVERHGGTLTVASEEGQGSTFSIRLPGPTELH